MGLRIRTSNQNSYPDKFIYNFAEGDFFIVVMGKYQKTILNARKLIKLGKEYMSSSHPFVKWEWSMFIELLDLFKAGKKIIPEEIA